MNQDPRTTNEFLISILEAALHAVRPDILFDKTNSFMELRKASRGMEFISVVGAGKAAIPMAAAAEDALDGAIDSGMVVVPHGYSSVLPSYYTMPSQVRVVESGHPIPSAEGAQAGSEMLDIVRGYGSDDLVVVVISGGASALLATPASGLSLDDLTQTTSVLLRSGATINEVNTVRKHITGIGGGRLAQAAYPANVYCYIVSDVIGDDPSFIGSGPCAPDDTTFHDARKVLDTYDLWDGLPDSVVRHLGASILGSGSDTPDSEDEIFETVQMRILGTNADALEGARVRATELGFEVNVVRNDLAGEAREVGAGIARSISEAAPGACLIWGGETTVTVEGDGVGGRNHELALAAALELERLGSAATILSAGTDGIDGLTQAAGTIVDQTTMARARQMGLDPEGALANNDSGTFFEKMRRQIKTGPTHTNVMDLVVAVKS